MFWILMSAFRVHLWGSRHSSLLFLVQSTQVQSGLGVCSASGC
jgi:hypothetical protein